MSTTIQARSVQALIMPIIRTQVKPIIRRTAARVIVKIELKMYEIPIKLFVRMNIRTKETLLEVQAESTDNAENNVIRGKRDLCLHTLDTNSLCTKNVRRNEV